jgi:nucleotide-binding universal stress UspA family protein
MYQRILVPIDGSPTSERGLDEAIKLAVLTRADLRLLHVVDELQHVTGFETCPVYATDIVPLLREAGETLLRKGRDRALRAGLKADTVLVEGLSPRLAEAVADQATSWRAELIVIGTHGRRGASRLLLGSDAEQVVRTAPVPVLLVRCTAASPGAAQAQAATSVTHPAAPAVEAAA